MAASPVTAEDITEAHSCDNTYCEGCTDECNMQRDGQDLAVYENVITEAAFPNGNMPKASSHVDIILDNYEHDETQWMTYEVSRAVPQQYSSTRRAGGRYEFCQPLKEVCHQFCCYNHLTLLSLALEL